MIDFNSLTLWHGTSEHLIPSIREFGLGGKNLLPELGVLEFLSETVSFLDFDEMDFGDPEHTMKSVTRPVVSAAISVVPDPMNGSKTA